MSFDFVHHFIVRHYTFLSHRHVQLGILILKELMIITGEYAGVQPAKKLDALLRSLAAQGKYSHTFGCLDPVQVTLFINHLPFVFVFVYVIIGLLLQIAQMAPYLSTVYVR
jgi:hypothetical protein